jgi:hypothetical protein
MLTLQDIRTKLTKIIENDTSFSVYLAVIVLFIVLGLYGSFRLIF